MDRPTSSGIWPDDRDFILRALGENPVPAGGLVYVDFHFEHPPNTPPEPEELALAEQAERDLRACLAGEMLPEYQARVVRRGSVVRFTYRKPSPMGELDVYLPSCFLGRPWAETIILVEFGEVLPWWRYSVPGWAAALGAVLAAAAGWALGRRMA